VHVIFDHVCNNERCSRCSFCRRAVLFHRFCFVSVPPEIRAGFKVSECAIVLSPPSLLYSSAIPGDTCTLAVVRIDRKWGIFHPRCCYVRGIFEILVQTARHLADRVPKK
jgi:hypothetical protein